MGFDCLCECVSSFVVEKHEHSPSLTSVLFSDMQPQLSREPTPQEDATGQGTAAIMAT